MHYVKVGSEEKGEASLEPNHTEFIFIDDGTQRKYGGEIEFRANLERAIAADFFAPQSASTVTHSSQYLSTTNALHSKASGWSKHCIFL